MLSSNLQSILDNRLRYLPEVTAKAIASVDWPTKLAEIAHSYGLHMDEIEDLQSVVMRSMIGMIEPADFESSLIAALALSPSNAEKMIAEINAKIFQPIHDFVMTGGKTPDGMSSSGITVEPSSGALEFNPDSEPVIAAPTQQSAGELILPEVTKTESIEPKIINPEPIGIPKPPQPKIDWSIFTQPLDDGPDDIIADGQ